MEKEKDNWLPLESNPEVMNNFMKDLGNVFPYFRTQYRQICSSGSLLSWRMGSINARPSSARLNFSLSNQRKAKIIWEAAIQSIIKQQSQWKYILYEAICQKCMRNYCSCSCSNECHLRLSWFSEIGKLFKQIPRRFIWKKFIINWRIA